MPAAAAFCTSSKPIRPLTQSTGSGRGRRLEQSGPDHLVHGVVPPDVLAYDEHVALLVEESCSVEPARAGEYPLSLAQPVGQLQEQIGGEGSVLHRTSHGAESQDLVDALRAADTTRAGCGTRSVVPDRGFAERWSIQVDGHDVEGLFIRQRSVGAVADASEP